MLLWCNPSQLQINKGAKMPRTRMSVAIAAGALLLASCATWGTPRHPSFTEPMVQSLRVGMTAEQIRQQFGAPDRIRKLTCGSETSDPWPCVVWQYDMDEFKINSFTFSTRRDPPVLNHWSIDRMYPAAARK
jgi:hypothetical protein